MSLTPPRAQADISSSSNRTEGSTSDEQEGLKGVVVSQSEEISRLEMLLDSQKHNFVSRDLLNGVTGAPHLPSSLSECSRNIVAVKSEATAEQLRAKVASLETKLATAKGDATFWYSEHEKRGEWLTSVAGPRMQEEKAKVAALLDENLKLKHALARLSHAAALPAVASPTTLALPGWNGEQTVVQLCSRCTEPTESNRNGPISARRLQSITVRRTLISEWRGIATTIHCDLY